MFRCSFQTNLRIRKCLLDIFICPRFFLRSKAWNKNLNRKSFPYFIRYLKILKFLQSRTLIEWLKQTRPTNKGAQKQIHKVVTQLTCHLAIVIYTVTFATCETLYILCPDENYYFLDFVTIQLSKTETRH